MATDIGQEYQQLRNEVSEKEAEHSNELKKAATIVKETKKRVKEERDKLRNLEEQNQRVKNNFTLQIRELKVKLSTQKMREEDNMRTIGEL